VNVDRKSTTALEGEGEALLKFIEPDAERREVRIRSL
jgi:hypothetical protein